MTKAWMRVTVIAAAALLLTGCGGGTEAKSSAASKTSASSAAAAKMTLKELCPQVESDLTHYSSVPSQARLMEIRSLMGRRRAASDLEAQNALDGFIQGLDAAQESYAHPTGMLPKLEVGERYDNGIAAFATRCKAAGSTAFQ